MADVIIVKNSATEIRIGISEFKEKKRIGLREWWMAPGNDEHRPTKKGLSLDLEQAKAVYKGLGEKIKELEAQEKVKETPTKKKK